MTIFFVQRLTCFEMGPSVLWEVLGRTNHLLSFDMTDRIENNVSNNSSIIACVFIATGMCLPSHCLATKLLPSNDRGTHTDTDFPLVWYGLHRKWHVQQFFYCCIYSLPWECIYWAVAQQWPREGDTHIQIHSRQQGDLKCLLIFFQNRESKLKTHTKSGPKTI
jgi:hypothetical protein